MRVKSKVAERIAKLADETASQTKTATQTAVAASKASVARAVEIGRESVLPEIERGLAQFTRIYAVQQLPDLPRTELDARIYLAMGVTLNSCLRIALERPDDLDEDHLIDLVAGMLALGLSG